MSASQNGFDRRRYENETLDVDVDMRSVARILRWRGFRHANYDGQWICDISLRLRLL